MLYFISAFLLFPSWFLIKPLLFPCNCHFREYLGVFYFSLASHSQNHVQDHHAFVYSFYSAQRCPDEGARHCSVEVMMCVQCCERQCLSRGRGGIIEKKPSAHQHLYFRAISAKGEGKFLLIHRLPVV